MPTTATATLFGVYQSVVRAQPVSAAAVGTDTLTIVHLLSTTPDFVYTLLRSVTGTASSGPLALILASANASQAFMVLPPGTGGAYSAQFDVLCEVIYSTIR